MDIRLQDEQATAELRDKGCLYVQTDGHHFVGVSTKHLAGYCNIDPLLPHWKSVSDFTDRIVDHYSSMDDGVEAVVTAAVGAIPLSQWGASRLTQTTGNYVKGVWADKIEPKDFQFERDGFEAQVKGRRVLLLEDMINQMASITKLIRVVREAGGIIVGAGAIAANRNVSAEALDIPKLVVLTDVFYDVWVAEECQLCEQGVPIVEDIGHGDKYKLEHPEYPGGYVTLLTA